MCIAIPSKIYSGGWRVKGQEAYAREEACANLLPLDLTNYPCSLLIFYFTLKICKLALISTPVINSGKIYKLVPEEKHDLSCFHLTNFVKLILFLSEI